MIEPPRVQYAKTSDGVKIAFSVMGNGPPLVYAPTALIAMSHDWEHQPSRELWESYASRVTLVRFDKRGIGASDRDVGDLSTAAQLRDIEAVVQRLGLDRFTLLGDGVSAAAAAAFAASYPSAVDRLIFWSPLLPEDRARTSAVFMRDNWSLGRRLWAGVVFPDGPVAAQKWISAAMKESIDAETCASYMEYVMPAEINDYAIAISAPVLIINRWKFRDGGRQQAVMNFGSRFSNSEVLWVSGDSRAPYPQHEPIVEAVHAFMGLASSHAADTSDTAIILFADIVDSTALTERLGDAAFREKARDLDSALRAIILDANGTTIEGKLLGDGVLAVFTSARQAIEAALSCGKAGDGGGLPLHVGIHAGDVIREENNVYGGAVNIAARIAEESAAGEVLVSGTVRELARTSAGVVFEDAGERALKGVGDAVRVWRVLAD